MAIFFIYSPRCAESSVLFLLLTEAGTVFHVCLCLGASVIQKKEVGFSLFSFFPLDFLASNWENEQVATDALTAF